MALTPPSNVVATRTSATSVKITWKNGSTSSGVYTQIHMSVDHGSYEFLVQPSRGATSYVESSVVEEGHIYQFRVLHSNGSTDSAFAYSDWVYDLPYPPTNVTATYPEDFKILLSWSNAAEEETRPRSRSVVERKEDNVLGEGKWVQISEPLGTSTSLTDSSGIYDNSRYRYRIRAKNKSGYSAYVYSNYVRTHPAMPTCSYSRLSATSMRITVDRSFAPYATGVDIQRRVNGGSWAVVASNTASTSVTDDFGAVDTVQYRVRCTVDGRNSDWEVSEQFVGVVAPNAPTITAKPSPVLSVGQTATVRWTPNHPDGTAQEQAQVVITKPNGSEESVLVPANVYSITVPMSELGIYSVRVRTKGLSETIGAWSQTVSWRYAELPVVTITNPATDGAVIDNLPLLVSWTVTDVSGASSTTLSIVDASTQRSLFSRTYQGSPSSVLLPRTSLPLENETSYTITVQAVNGYGLSASTTRTFSVEWELPAKPSIEVEEGDGKSAAVTVKDYVDKHVGSTSTDADGTLLSVTFYGLSEVIAEAGVIESADLPYVKIYGKNLLEPRDSGTYSGITVQRYENGHIRLSGTATTSGTIMLARATKLGKIPAGTYIFNGSATDLYGSDAGLSLLIGGTGGQYIEAVDGMAIELDSASSVTLSVAVTASQTIDDVTVSAMLRSDRFEDDGFEAGGEICAVYTGQLDGTDPTLRGLPNGVRDEYTMYPDKPAVLTRRVGHTYSAATDGVTGTVGVDVLSSTGVIEDGADVVYQLAEPYVVSCPNDEWEGSLIQGTDQMPSNVTSIFYSNGINRSFVYNDGMLYIGGYSDGDSETESISVQRISQDGTAWTVATGLHSGESVIDPLAPLGVNVTYRAIAYAASGASSENETDARIEAEPTWVVNFGDRAQEYIELKYSPRSSKTLSHGGASYHFADGGAGGGLPVWYGTTDRDVSGSSSFHSIYEETTDRLMELSDEYPVGWLRDPRGHRVRAHIEPTVSSDFGPVHQIKLNWDAVRWREAWDG